MRRLGLFIAGLTAAFMLCTLAAAPALAVTFLLAEWLANGAPVTTELTTTAADELELTDKKTFVGAATVLCSMSLDGWVGPNSLDHVSEILSLSGVGISNTPLVGTALMCTALKVCEASSAPTVYPVHMPWNTEVELIEGTGFFADLLFGTGGNPGWEITCLVLGVSVTDECTPASAGESIAEIAFEGPTALANFSDAFTELAGAKLATCSQGGAESGEVNGGGTLTLTGGGELRLSSSGGLSATSTTTSLSGEGKEGAELNVQYPVPIVDKAALSGEQASHASGTVEYNVYLDKECKTLAVKAGIVTVTSGSVPPSNEEALEPGTYYWQATYSGDSLNNGSKSVCGTEVSTVKTSTSLTTLLSSGSESGDKLGIPEGATASDTATLSGTNAITAGGTVTYDIYSDPECEHLYAEAGKVTVLGESVPKSSNETLPMGTYYWQAHYSGDTLNFESTSTCGTEITSVEPALTASLSGEGHTAEELVVQGGAITDDAMLQEENASTATGTVKYDVYSDKACKALVAHAGEVAVSGGSIPPSSKETLEPGTYYWRASYSGDSGHAAATSVCDAEIAIVETPTTMSTSLSGEGQSGTEITVNVGAAVSDKATLSGTNAAKASGDVEYRVYSDNECKDLVVLAGDVEVSSGSVPASSEEKLPAGTYYWQAVYSGDGANHAVSGSCGSEVSTVTTPVTTTASDTESSGQIIELAEGASMKDAATLHGPHAATATGTMKYAVYSDAKCEHLAASAGEVTVSGVNVPASSKVTLKAGFYYWQGEYSGDSEMPAAKSVCGETMAQVQPPSYQYAGFGDSYSSGEGTASYYPNTNRAAPFGIRERNLCRRGELSWPARVASTFFGVPAVREPEVFRRQGRFIFRACSGAVTSNIWNALQSGQYNEWSENEPGVPLTNVWIATPAQAWWLLTAEEPPKPNPRVGLATFTIGGNDANFGGIAQSCLSGPPTYTQAGCLAAINASLNGQVPGIEANLQAILTKIREWAPNAMIRVPMYPQPLNEEVGDVPVGLLRDRWGRAFGILRVENLVARELNRFVFLLDQRLITAVERWREARGLPQDVVSMVSTTFNAFFGHRLGDPAAPWVNGVELPVRESFHPNCLGNVSVATMVLQNLNVPVPPPGTWLC